MIYENQTIGPYQIIEELGRGGMAIVYRALDTQIDREVALKLLMPQYVDDNVFLHRFIKEGQNTKRLRHPNIVRTYDAGHVDEYYYIAMEVIEGCTLAEYVQQNGSLLSNKEIFDILSQIAGALDYAHSLGFLHRDIKLTNILICDDGRALLSDFGAAKHMSAEYTMVTATGQSIGTPSYMSPEQARAEVNLDYRTDVYSLGVVAYKLFTGRMPFTADSQPELLYKIVYEEAQDPTLVNPDLSDAIANVLRRVLSKQAELRYESAGNFVAAIIATKRWRLNVAEELHKSETVSQVPAVKSPKAGHGLWMAIGALATVMVMIGVANFWGEHGDLPLSGIYAQPTHSEAPIRGSADDFTTPMMRGASTMVGEESTPWGLVRSPSDSLSDIWTVSMTKLDRWGDALVEGFATFDRRDPQRWFQSLWSDESQSSLPSDVETLGDQPSRMASPANAGPKPPLKAIAPGLPSK